MLSYINLGLILIIIIIVFFCFIMYFQVKSVFDKMYIKYTNSMSTDMKVNNMFEPIWTKKS